MERGEAPVYTEVSQFRERRVPDSTEERCHVGTPVYGDGHSHGHYGDSDVRYVVSYGYVLI